MGGPSPLGEGPPPFPVKHEVVVAEQSNAPAVASSRSSWDDGGVVIEYGLIVATITLALGLVGPAIVGAVTSFFAGMPAGLPAP